MNKVMKRGWGCAAIVTILVQFGCNDSTLKESVESPEKIQKTVPEAVSNAPFYLSLDELAAWTGSSSLAEPKNVSSVPLAARFVDRRSQLNPNLPSDAKVLIAPDGISNHANYLEEQPKFNHYMFTHWSLIDSINWFGGTAGSNVSIPSRPWVEAAHRNGVKVLGTVFFAPKAWGGTEEQPTAFLRREQDGRFLYARKLIEIANYYGFDGWLINQETDLGDADPKIGEEYLAFMAELTAQRPEGMEIHWYDSMLPDGRVVWQNELNSNNARFLQDRDGPTADAMFVNYWWNRERIETSLKTAAALSRSPFDVYTGADLWPGRPAQGITRAPQWLETLDSPQGGPETSIALFASNYNFINLGSDEFPAETQYATDPSDVASYYRAEQRLFAGDDYNLAITDAVGKWPGIGSRIPARSTLNTLPFTSNFSTGHGRLKAQQGKVVHQAWHDMAVQDILPSWQFAVHGNMKTRVDFDFDRAFRKGNSLRIVANPASGLAGVPLYKTAFELNTPITVEVVHALSTKYQGASLWLETAQGQRYSLPLKPTMGEWSRSSLSIDASHNDTVIRIGIELADSIETQAVLHIGELHVRAGDET